jgi:hypothetical protein
MDKFPEAFNRFKTHYEWAARQARLPIDKDISRVQNEFERWAGPRWVGSKEQEKALLTESIKYTDKLPSWLKVVYVDRLNRWRSKETGRFVGVSMVNEEIRLGRSRRRLGEPL